MADTKITALAAIATVDPAADVLPIVDISDTSMAASGTTKKVTSNQILGSGGVATLASATITGAATVGTTLGVTGVSTLASAVVTGALTSGTTTLVSHAAGYTGKVGIGTATPAATLHVKGSGRVDGDYNLFDFYKDNGSTRLGYLLFRDDGPNYFNVNSNQPLYLTTNNTAQVQVETSGDVKINTGNVVMGTSGKGIDFSATAGTGTSELLADYEEGTFTATLTGGTTNPTIPVTTTARYTKVGRLVTVQIAFENVITTGASGTIGISGLPFANGSVSSTGIATLYNLATYTGSPVAFIDNTVSTIGFFGNVSSSTFSSVTHNAGVAGYSTTTITYSV